MGTIVVGVDESDGAAAAIRWAAAEGKVRSWDVVAVHVWHVPGGDHVIGSYGEQEALESLDAIVRAALGGGGAGDPSSIERRVVEGQGPADALIEASADADLLAVGERGLGGFRGMLLGSVSQRLIHESHRPVAVVRERERGDDGGSFGRVVVGIDGSYEASVALDWAVDEARARRATLEVVHGWRLPASPGPLVFDADMLGESARTLVETAVERVDTTGVTVEQTATPFGGAGAVLESAENADLVVVGSRGSSGVRRLLLGSVSTHVALHAPCTVVVVPPRD